MKRVLAIAALLAAGRAAAITYAFDYVAGDTWGPQHAWGRLEVADMPNAYGSRDVTAVTGEVDGDAITGIIANPNGAAPSYSADRMFIYDNVLSFDAMHVTNPGLFFASSAGFEYNLFSEWSRHVLYRARPGVVYAGNSHGTMTVTAVPEPATWALTVVGFCAVGAVARRRRGRTVAA